MVADVSNALPLGSPAGLLLIIWVSGIIALEAFSDHPVSALSWSLALTPTRFSYGLSLLDMSHLSDFHTERRQGPSSSC